MTNPRATSLATALNVLFAGVVYPQTPDFRVQVWGYIVADFSARIVDRRPCAIRCAD